MNKGIILILAIFNFTVANAQVKKEITLEDIWKNGTFRSEYVWGLRSMNDGIHYSTLEYDYVTSASFIVKYKYETGEVTDTLVNSQNLINSEGKNIGIESYQFSSDETRVLIATEQESIYRHSTKEYNYIFDFSSGNLKPLSDIEEKQSHAEFSPNSSRVAFVRGNNLFVYDDATSEETQITFDGKWNEVINGASDWVYEEEFAFDKAWFWSPDGIKIAYYRFDESKVKEFSMDLYGELYPSQYRFKYPKAGEDNSVVSIHIYDVETGSTVKVDVGEEKDQYIPRIKWTQDPNKLYVYRMNRLQNKLELLMADATSGKTKVILKEESPYYIDVTDDLTFLSDNKHFIWTSELGGFNHIYLYTLDGKKVRQITKGEWDVTSFKGFNEESQTLYFTAAKVAATNKEVYAVDIKGKKLNRISEKDGYNDADFSNTYSYYIHYHSNTDTPYLITLHDASGKEIRVLKDNLLLQEKLDEYQLSKKDFFSFKTSYDVNLNGWMIKPNDFDPSKKYPVLMHVYGGPGVQTVTNQWSSRDFFWHQYLSQLGYIVVSVDNRGTGSRGEKFKKCTYGQLGKLETEDQIEVAKYLSGLEYVDGNRIGIQGWSYGGYMSSLCMTLGADYFKMGIAVAPVTSWRFYDTIYTERFLKLPQDNTKGYDDYSPLSHVDKLKGHYLLVHGMADDNVHFQNTVEMINALIDGDKHFDLYLYPNLNHSIYGGNARYHLYTKMTEFIKENL